MKPIARRSFLFTVATAAGARALNRTPITGTLRLRLPFYFGGLDPHSSDDALSALFAPALFDSLFALDSAGKPYPTIARALPERIAAGTKIRLRPELVTARGKALSAADVLFSLQRARSLAGSAVLSVFSTPMRDRSDPLSFVVPDANPEALAKALASPLTALVPRGFSPLAPDGTGAFKAALGSDGVSLVRNENAARGAAFLERIELSRALDLADSLRAFEAGQVDVGWLGNGLYRPRLGSVPLEGPSFGWMVLRSGLDAKAWGAPGIAQQLCTALPSAALARFGIRPVPGTSEAVRWGGGPSTLLVCDDTPLALELARTLEPLLSSPGNEIRATPIPRSAWLDARRTRRFRLLLDFVRSPGSSFEDAAGAVLSAVDPALARRPPRNLASLHDLTRTLPLGILGEMRVSGAQNPIFEGLDTWLLGSVWSNPDKS